MLDLARVQQAVRNSDVVAALRSPRRLKTEVLAGLVVALALIPEAISFSIIAGVDPRVGLFASFTMAVTIAVVGGRPAMISAATGAVALVVAPIAREHGIDYLFATVILAGILQIVLSALGVAKLMRFIPRSVMVGFVNSLAILIFLAQVPHMTHVPWLVYVMIAAGLVILIGLPRLTVAVPAPLVAIVVLTALTMGFGWAVPNVGDEGELPSTLPQWLIPDVPYNLETLKLIAPFAVAMALVGLLESLMTAKLVDDILDDHSNKTREGWGQGIANVVTGFFGGMGGCAMIGQSVINVKSGGSTRLSTFVSGDWRRTWLIVAAQIREHGHEVRPCETSDLDAALARLLGAVPAGHAAPVAVAAAAGPAAAAHPWARNARTARRPAPRRRWPGPSPPPSSRSVCASRSTSGFLRC